MTNAESKKIQLIRNKEEGSEHSLEHFVIRHGSIFSGIGGFDLAAKWIGWENVFQVEIDDYCTKVLEKNFPNAKRYRDIREFEGKQYRGAIDVVSGGFPCQPFSVAGKQKGKEDNRYLWPEMLRVISEIKPTWIVGENVTGIIPMELDNMLDDMELLGYETETFIIPAASVDARHRRNRVWIVGWNTNSGNWDKRKVKKMEKKQDTKSTRIRATLSNTKSKDDGSGNFESIDGQIQQPGECVGKRNVSDTTKKRMEGKRRIWKQGTEENVGEKLSECGHYGNRESENRWPVEPAVGRVANGVSHRVDRLKGLGNAVVPQVAFEIFRAIADVSI